MLKKLKSSIIKSTEQKSQSIIEPHVYTPKTEKHPKFLIFSKQ